MPKGIYKRKPRTKKDPQFKWAQKASPIVKLMEERIEKAQTDMQNSLAESAFSFEEGRLKRLEKQVVELEAECLRLYRDLHRNN